MSRRNNICDTEALLCSGVKSAYWIRFYYIHLHGGRVARKTHYHRLDLLPLIAKAQNSEYYKGHFSYLLTK